MIGQQDTTLTNQKIKYKLSDLKKECKAISIENNEVCYGEYIYSLEDKKHYLKCFKYEPYEKMILNLECTELIEVSYDTVECFTGEFIDEKWENRCFTNPKWSEIPRECWLGIPVFKKLKDLEYLKTRETK